MRRLHLVTAPTVEPVTLAEAKAYRRVDGSVENTLIADLIVAAREVFEGETGRQVLEATWLMDLDRFPTGGAPIEVPRPPLLAVSSITYRDSAGTEQTWSSSEYVVDAYAGPFAPCGLIYPAPGYCYPTTRCAPNSVSVTFTAGYGTTVDDVPEGVRATIQALIGDLYEERETFVMGTIVAPNPATSRAMNRYRPKVFA